MASRTPSQIRALIRLLGDEDARTSSIAREKLMETGEEALPYLAETVRDPDARIRGRSRILIDEIRFALLKDRFRAYAALPDDRLDLETGAFLIAACGYPEVDMAPYRRQLDALADGVRADLEAMRRGTLTPVLAAEDTGDAAPSAPLELLALNHRLFVHEGFRGNRDAYYDPDNSYLNRVLDRRLGIPISLAVVQLLVGWRLGMPLRGVALPGHFVVGYFPDFDGHSGAKNNGADTVHGKGTLWIDPFHGGRLLTEEDCHRIVTEFGHEPDPVFLQPAPVRLIIVRMLMNLVNIYRHTNRPQQAAELRTLIRIVLDPAGDGDDEHDLYDDDPMDDDDDGEW